MNLSHNVFFPDPAHGFVMSRLFLKICGKMPQSFVGKRGGICAEPEGVQAGSRLRFVSAYPAAECADIQQTHWEMVVFCPCCSSMQK